MCLVRKFGSNLKFIHVSNFDIFLFLNVLSLEIKMYQRDLKKF